MIWLSMVVLALAFHSFFEAALFRHYTRQCKFCGVIRMELLRYSEGVMFLAIAYMCAELRWLINGLDNHIPEADELIWTIIEGCFIYLNVWICRTGRAILKMDYLQFKQCFAKYHIGG